MSSEGPAIRVRDLSKSYRLYPRPQDRLKQSLSFRLQQLRLGKLRTYYREFWALQGVSFDVGRAETVGIVGRNGSGKSTLLQLICGTLQPTGGSCETRGSVAALLELGTGFNPLFSGLDNVYLNGQILGLSRQAIDRLLPEILAFADIGEFIHQPVKTYSSGMAVRLAFAVAVARRPEVLIVDEALAVGDDAFRRKCFARIQDLRAQGTTLLFVSHAAALVVELCDRALLLDNGQLLYDGSPRDTIALYTKLLFTPPTSREKVREEILNSAGRHISGSGIATSGKAGGTQGKNIAGIRTGPRAFFVQDLVSRSRVEYEVRGAIIEDPHLETMDGERVNVLVTSQTYRYCYRVRFLKSANEVQFGMLIKTVTGRELGGAAHPSLREDIGTVDPGEFFSVCFRFRCLLNEGTYFLNAGVRGRTADECEPTYLHRILDALAFKVLPSERPLDTGIVTFGVDSYVRKTETP